MTHCITLKHYQPTAGTLSSTGLRPMVFSAVFDKKYITTPSSETLRTAFLTSAFSRRSAIAGRMRRSGADCHPGKERRENQAVQRDAPQIGRATCRRINPKYDDEHFSML